MAGSVEDLSDTLKVDDTRCIWSIVEDILGVIKIFKSDRSVLVPE